MSPTDTMTPQRLREIGLMLAPWMSAVHSPEERSRAALDLKAYADQLERNGEWQDISTAPKDELTERLREDFQSEEVRYGYAESHLNTVIGAQIYNTRKQRGLSQEELAALVGTKQPGIARLENVNYDSWKVETLRKIARALGVRLSIRFEEFGTLPREIQTFKDRLTPRPFQDDPVFALSKPPEAK